LAATPTPPPSPAWVGAAEAPPLATLESSTAGGGGGGGGGGGRRRRRGRRGGGAAAPPRRAWRALGARPSRRRPLHKGEERSAAASTADAKFRTGLKLNTRTQVHTQFWPCLRRACGPERPEHAPQFPTLLLARQTQQPLLPKQCDHAHGGGRARPASKPSTKSSGHRGTFHAGSTQCKRHVCDDLSSVIPMKKQTASCSPAPRPAPQTNCIRTLQTPYESILQQKTGRGTLERRLRPGQGRLGLASEIRARSRGVH